MGRRFEPKRPVRTMPVVVLEMDPEDLLQMTTANDQQPVQALSADGTDPPLRIGVRVRGLERRNEHLGTLGVEHVVEATTELRVPVADKKAHPPAAFGQHHEQVAGLLGDPGATGVGSHASEMDPASVMFDEEQDIEPSQPDGVDREEESQARMPAACWRRNARHVVAVGRGVGSIP
jgi:hypothetical protein